MAKDFSPAPEITPSDVSVCEANKINQVDNKDNNITAKNIEEPTNDTADDLNKDQIGNNEQE